MQNNGVDSLCLASCKWGAILMKLGKIAQQDNADGSTFYIWQVTGQMTYGHLYDLGGWSVVPTSSCSPAFVHREMPGVPPGSQHSGWPVGQNMQASWVSRDIV